jgi:hypothetical protein
MEKIMTNRYGISRPRRCESNFMWLHHQTNNATVKRLVGPGFGHCVGAVARSRIETNMVM